MGAVPTTVTCSSAQASVEKKTRHRNKCINTVLEAVRMISSLIMGHLYSFASTIIFGFGQADICLRGKKTGGILRIGDKKFSDKRNWTNINR
jgi:hypothetical protein